MNDREKISEMKGYRTGEKDKKKEKTQWELRAIKYVNIIIKKGWEQKRQKKQVIIR